MTLLRYNVDNAVSLYAQVEEQKTEKTEKKVEEKFQPFVYVNSKLEEFIYLLDILDSPYDKVINLKPICIFLWKVIATIYSLSIFFPFESRWVGTLEMIETYFSSWKQNWNFNKLYLQLQIFSRKIYSNCNWNAIISSHWKGWFQ